MDVGKNWILVEKASANTKNQPILVTDRRRFPINDVSLNKEELKLQNIHVLNEKIQKRLADSYRKERAGEAGASGGSVRDGARVVDESFSFIDDENNKDENAGQPAPSSPSNRLDSLISCRDSRGEVDAVFERRKRRESDSSRHDYLRADAPSRLHRVTPSRTVALPRLPNIREGDREDIYYDASAIPSTSRGLFRPSEDTPIIYENQPDIMPPIRRIRPRKMPYYGRSDSLDSGSVRINRRYQLDRQDTRPRAAFSYDHLNRPNWEGSERHYDWSRSDVPSVFRISRPSSSVPLHQHPHTLRRQPDYYDKCDLCAFKLFRPGDFCAVCGRGGSRVAARPQAKFYTAEQILNARRLGRDTREMNLIPSRGAHIPTLYTQQRIHPSARRPNKSPVYRYGASLPEALYDYEAWARRKDRNTMRRRAGALAVALLAIALVVSAGVVLAAVNN